MLKKILSITCFFILSVSAMADEVDYGIEIRQIGLANDDTGYFLPHKQLAIACPHNVISFDLNTNNGRSFFTLLTATKLAGKKLSIISYKADASGKCTLISMAME